MIVAAGIDLGGTKSEIQLFDEAWQVLDKSRTATPATYDALVELLGQQVGWAYQQAGRSVPVGLAAAGLIYPDGTSFTANLPVKGKPLIADLSKAAGHRVVYVNDCRALALSEAELGAGRGYDTVMSLILGTGVGGGIVHNGRLREGPAGTGGEFGHIPISASWVVAHKLPIIRCGCGRMGCYETYVAGPGMSSLAEYVLDQRLSPEDVVELKNTSSSVGEVWRIWTGITAELLLTLVQVADPDIIVLGGGLSTIPAVNRDLEEALCATQIPGFGAPPIVIAQGGDASGARGAAIAASRERLAHE